MEKEALNRYDFMENKNKVGVASIKVYRNGVDSGIAGYYNGINKADAILKFEQMKVEYLKNDKKAVIVLELIFDGEVIEKWEKE